MIISNYHVTFAPQELISGVYDAEENSSFPLSFLFKKGHAALWQEATWRVGST